MSVKVTPSTIVQRVEETLAAPLDQDLALFAVAQGKFYGLDDISARVWALIEQPASVQHICDRLRTEFDVDQQTCEADICELVERLCDEQLVTVAT